MEVAATEQQRSKRQRGAGFPKGVSGNPKGRAAIRERADDLFGIMSADFAPLSAVDEVLLRQACLLLARSQRVHRLRDVDAGIRLSSEARRILAGLRKSATRRESETPSLAAYLAETYGKGPPSSASGAPAAQDREEAAEEPGDGRRTGGLPVGDGEAAK
jgi:hypothetical protein